MASSSYLPDYTTLWSHPLTPHFPRPASPPRRSATSTTSDARRQAHEQALRNVAQAQAVHQHARGDHLPTRRRTARAGVGGGSGGGGRRKEMVRMAERDADWTWSGSGVTEQEERELSDEEETRMTWRENLLSYGRNDIVVLGRGRTTAEELRDQEDREAIAHTHAAANAAAVNGDMTAAGGDVSTATGGSPIHSVSGVRGSWGTAAGRRHAAGAGAGGGRGGGAGGRGGRRVERRGRRRGSGQDDSASGADGGSASDASGAGGGSGAGPPGGDPYEGEYTLDDGAGAGGAGGDLDAGIETFD